MYDIIEGSAIGYMRKMESRSVQTCVTSPPYWGLRDYGVDGQLGLEASPHEYIDKLVDIFHEARRVLRDDGTLWLNMGDTYMSVSPKDVDGGARQDVSLRIGISQESRVGGKLDNWENHRVAAAAEAMVCEAMGRPFHGTLPGPDGRADFWLGGRMIDVKWIGPRESGHLIKPPIQTWADVYVAVGGRTIETLRILGWASSKRLKNTPPKDFGYGPCHAIHTEELSPFSELLAMSGKTKPKDLVGIPWRVALALQADGWWLRQDIIWHKPNPMPESVTDRCTKSHEYIFLLTKSKRYYYDHEAIKEPASYAGQSRGGSTNRYEQNEAGMDNKEYDTRNKRSVWTVNTKPYKDAHFATFPPELIEPCIKAGCPEGGTVLDPFMGSGTTLMVACRLGRKSIGIELNPTYIKMAKDRIDKDSRPPTFKTNDDTNTPLFSGLR